jgi:hypothetical protein
VRDFTILNDARASNIAYFAVLKPSGSIFMRELNRRFTLLLQTITPGAILPPTSTARSHQAPAARGNLFGSLLRMFIDHFGASHNPLPACSPPLRPAASVQSLGTINAPICVCIGVHAASRRTQRSSWTTAPASLSTRHLSVRISQIALKVG